MIDSYERCGLIINDQVVRTPVAIASMAGIVDAAYVLARADHIGAAFIGGYSIDEATMEASRQMAAEGRAEFLYDDPIAELRAQVDALEGSGIVTGLNLRGSGPASYAAVADAIGDGVVYEIDAHCRQPAMTAAGCGETLLKSPHLLVDIVRALKNFDVTVSVKIRAGVAADDRRLARLLWKAGADIIHADLMDFGYARLRQIRNDCPLTSSRTTRSPRSTVRWTCSPTGPIWSRWRGVRTSGLFPASTPPSAAGPTRPGGTMRPSSSAAAGTCVPLRSAACR